jgi:hypothetical protein
MPEVDHSEFPPLLVVIIANMSSGNKVEASSSNSVLTERIGSSKEDSLVGRCFIFAALILLTAAGRINLDWVVLIYRRQINGEAPL